MNKFIEICFCIIVGAVTFVIIVGMIYLIECMIDDIKTRISDRELFRRLMK